MNIIWIGDSTLTELTLLGIAFVLSAVIGLERGRQAKSAGLRTHTLVGLGAAVFTLVSAYGFASVTGPSAIVDPSRIAAQIVSGIGFLGAGVIFVRQGAVSGLTTAASIWVTASVGMACGAGAPALAAMATALHLLAVLVLGKVGKRFAAPSSETVIRLRYKEGHGLLRTALALAAEGGIDVVVSTMKDISKPGKPRHEADLRVLDTRGRSIAPLLDAWSALPGAMRVSIRDRDDD